MREQKGPNVVEHMTKKVGLAKRHSKTNWSSTAALEIQCLAVGDTQVAREKLLTFIGWCMTMAGTPRAVRTS